MKVEQINNKEFEPITIQITIESEDELMSLVYRSTLLEGEIKNALGDSYEHAKNKPKDWYAGQEALCHTLHSIIESRGLL